MEQPTGVRTAAGAAEVSGVLVHESAHLRWYHVEEPDSPVLDRLAEEFGFHELEIEDCRHLRHTAKLEEYENHVFVIANTLHFLAETTGVWFGELDFFLGQDFLVTVHTGPTRSVKQVLSRVKSVSKMQRPDRVLHALLDNMVDRYLPVLDQMGERIDQIEDEIQESPTQKTLEEIFALRRGLSEFRRTVGSMREMVNFLMRLRPPYFRADMAAYWRDLYDHIIRALTMIETYRDLLASVLEIYLTATANRTNEIMKVLTIWATIVLPLVVITGYFGMNFAHLPLMEWAYGPTVVHIVMVLLPVGLLLYFRKRRWL
ncbi:MAG: magnesium/cobalt transporter CorA [Candidatus Acidoferrales bacterium]